MTKMVLAVHGGACRLDSEETRRPRCRALETALAKALRTGQKVLLGGGSAIEAVCAATVFMEDCELFNAGRGAVLCAKGAIELSASVMNGNDLSVGAMTGLRQVKNPVLAAKALLKHRHGLMFGESAESFARQAGVEMAPLAYFMTPQRKRQWEKAKKLPQVTPDPADSRFPSGTVGAVARDAKGNLAAATSTGGMANQLEGRIGDTPVIGAGTWADNKTCAISATGNGDAFARLAFARRVADLMELCNLAAGDAAWRTLADIARVNGQGGCIVIDALGRLAFPFNTEHMLRGFVIGKGAPYVGILADKEVKIKPESKPNQRRLR